MNYYTRWVFFRGYICTANDDGSIPLNSLVVADFRHGREDEAQRIVDMHNELLAKARKKDA